MTDKKWCAWARSYGPAQLADVCFMPEGDRLPPQSKWVRIPWLDGPEPAPAKKEPNPVAPSNAERLADIRRRCAEGYYFGEWGDDMAFVLEQLDG